MNSDFAEILRELRIQKGLSQQQLAERIYVTRSTITNWETRRRIPDAIMIHRLAECLGVDVGVLLGPVESLTSKPEAIVVDDEKMMLSDSLLTLEEALPDVSISGFTDPLEALKYVRSNKIALAFLDIEMGPVSGLELCQELLDIDHKINVIFLTAYKEYSFEAWQTDACGFLLKPITTEDVQNQLSRLRYPVRGISP